MRTRHDEAVKIALCDHGDLGKLCLIQSDDLLDLSIDLGGLVHHALIRHREPDFLFLHHHLVAALGRAQIFRAAVYRIGLSRIGEYQLDKGRRAVLGVLGTQRFRCAALAARPAVQCVGDGIEDRGLARAGVAGDKVQTLCAQLCKVELGRAGIRPECG